MGIANAEDFDPNDPEIAKKLMQYRSENKYQEIREYQNLSIFRN